MSRPYLVVFFFALAACSASSTKAAPENGVDDVLKACEQRAAWQHASSNNCSTCIGLASTPRCPCSDREEAGKCSDQVSAKNAEPTCTDPAACVTKCAASDCACVDACYAASAACRTLASAADGCVAEVCDPSCR